jgi:AcrR family transcriptional regulator
VAQASSKPGKRRVRNAGTRNVPREVRSVQMLDVAGEVFAARGYHAASMDEIAERADVSKPMVYSYFESKETLYCAYIERSGERLLAAIDEVFDPELSIERELWVSTLAFLGYVEHHRDGWAVLYQELAARGGTFATTVAEIRDAIMGRVAVLIGQSVEGADQTQRALRAEALAHGFVGAGESLANWWIEHPDQTREAVARRIMEVGWLGLERATGGRRWSPPAA